MKKLYLWKNFFSIWFHAWPCCCDNYDIIHEFYFLCTI